MSAPIAPGDEFYELDEPARIHLLTLWRDAVELDVDRVDVGPGVVIGGRMSVRAISGSIGRGCFHSDDLQAADWDDGDPVDLRLRLRNSVAASFASADDLVAELFGEAATPLHESESWELLEALQTVPVPGDEGAFTSFGVARS